jgi:hypothetical protein
VSQHFGTHLVATAAKDKHAVLEQLLKAKVFSCISAREYTCFGNVTRTLLAPHKKPLLRNG